MGNDYSIIWDALGTIATLAMVFATFLTLKNNTKQFKELQKQNFENSLFRLFFEAKQNLSEKLSQNMASNYEHFLSSRTKGEDTNVDENGNEIFPEPNFENMQISIKYWYNNIPDLRIFFIRLYRVIKYIDESNFGKKEKYQYMSTIRAQLTENEQLWLFYNCTVGEGRDKFKPLVEKWSLLKNMPIHRLLNGDHIKWIADTAISRKANNSCILEAFHDLR